MITLERASNLSRRLKAQIQSHSRDLLGDYPLEKYINCLNNYPEISDYRYLSSEVKRFCNDLVKANNERVLESYHKLLLVTLILNSGDRIETKKLPDDIKLLYEQNFERIIDRIECNTTAPGLYSYPNDSFLKDLGICTLRLIPTGARKMHLASLPLKRFLFTKGLRQTLRGLILLVFELKGYKPLYYGHLDSNDPNLMAEFTPEGHIRHYQRVAKLLKMNRNVKGLMAIAWYFDPELESISPRLNYLREIPMQNGGQLFCLGSTAQTIENAILKSPTRRELYRQGKYVPTEYLLIWPRKSLIMWANRKAPG